MASLQNQIKSQPSSSTSRTDDNSPSEITVKRQWVNTNPPFPKGPSRFLIVGVANTGKTTLGIRLSKQIFSNEEDPHQHLIIISPNYLRDDKLKHLAADAKARGVEVIVFTSFDKKTMEKFLSYMDDLALNNVRSVVYVDDPVGVGTFTANVNQKSPWNSFVTGSKHYKSDIFFSTQAIGGISKSARKNFDVFIFLPDMTSRKELYESCRFVQTQAQFDALMDTYASNPYCALWVNVQFGRKGVYAIDENGTVSSITEVPR